MSESERERESARKRPGSLLPTAATSTEPRRKRGRFHAQLHGDLKALHPRSPSSLFFGRQSLAVPDFLMSESRPHGDSDGSPCHALDKWRCFAMRGCGGAFLPIGGFPWQLSPEADKCMLFSFLSVTH